MTQSDVIPVESVDVIEEVEILVAGAEHYQFAPEICGLIEEAARARGTGIAKRKPEYVQSNFVRGISKLMVELTPKRAE